MIREYHSSGAHRDLLPYRHDALGRSAVHVAVCVRHSRSVRPVSQIPPGLSRPLLLQHVQGLFRNF